MMASEQSNILKRQEQLTKWIESETDKASKSIKQAHKIKFSNEVQFLSACNSNDWQEIERLFKLGININCTQDDGLTSLHQACIDDDENLVRFLIDQGAEIDAQDKEGWTPLFAAISCNYLPITKYLISRGARMDIVSFDGELPLDQTTNEALISLIKQEMKAKNLDPDEIRNRERTAMLKDIEIMRQTNDFSKFTLADNGGSLLHVAVSKDYIDVLEKLLEIINPEQLNHTDKDGWNALHVAAHWGNKSACMLLVDADIDFDQVTANNKTVLEVSDDDAKPYIREEIRKARFRRQDRAAFKRPAASPSADSKPSDTKIICQEKTSPLPVDVKPQLSNSDSPIAPITNQMTDVDKSCDNTKPVLMTFDNAKSINSVDTDVKLNTNVVVCRSDIDPSKAPEINEIQIPKPSYESSQDNSMENIIIEETKPIDVNFTKPVPAVVPTVKVVESESQRKDKARHVRSTRRLTQGVSLEDIDEAKKLGDKHDNGEKCLTNNKTSTNGTANLLSQFNNENDKDTENKSDIVINDIESHKNIPQIQISNGDSPKTILTEQNTDPSEIIISISNPESLEQSDLKKKTGNHLVNKRKTRDRQPTGIVDLKDVQAAQKEFLPEYQNAKNPVNLKAKEPIMDYKLLYENELKEKEKLQRNLARMHRDLEHSEKKIKDLQNNRIISKSPIATILPDSDSLASIDKLREENKKMKEANSALIRVISRLSHPQTKSIPSSS